VVLCRDTITPSQIPNTLTHELIHAYDHCRGKGFSLTNCEHHACTEVRSPSSSGCMKVFRGQLAGNRGIRL
jgi:inner membrane protease ATP23